MNCLRCNKPIVGPGLWVQLPAGEYRMNKGPFCSLACKYPEKGEEPEKPTRREITLSFKFSEATSYENLMTFIVETRALAERMGNATMVESLGKAAGKVEQFFNKEKRR